MGAMTEFRTVVDSTVKAEAEAIYAEAGLTLEEAFQNMLAQTIRQGSYAGKPCTPNQETQAAMLAARRGETTSFETVEAMMADLCADH